MSMTVTGPSSALIHSVFEPIVFLVTSTEQSGGTFFKFKFIADIYIESLDSPYAYTKRARVRINPNSSGAGIFRVDNIAADYTAITTGDPISTITKNIHTLGSNYPTKIWSNNEGRNFRKIKVNFGQEYATSATLPPVVNPVFDEDNFVSCLMSSGMVAPHTWDESENFTATGSTEYVDYRPRESTSRVLSDRETTTLYTSTLASDVSVINQDVTNFEYRTFAILMDDLQPIYSDAVSAYVALYDSSDVLLDSQFFTAGTDGGTAPADSDHDYERLQYIGVGPGNLTAQEVDVGFATHFNAGTVAYYEVFFMQDSVTVPANGTTGDMASLCYRFTIIPASCIYRSINGTSKYNYVTLGWQNSLGGWDYQGFALKHQRTTGKIKRTTFDKVAGNWDTASTGAGEIFAFRGDEGGVKTTKVSARQSMVANTDIVNEDEVAFLENLWLSPKVLLFNFDGTAIPITLTGADWIRKNNLNEGGPFTYQVAFEYGKERPTVR